MNISISDLLTSYGAWVRNDDDKLGCKSPTLMLMRTAPKQDNNESKSKARAQPIFIDDDTALRVDKAMKALADYSMVLYNILNLHFVKGDAVSVIAKKYYSGVIYPCGTKQASNYDVKPLITEGAGFISGWLIHNKSI